MDVGTINLVLNIILVGIAVWMVTIVKGIGGVVGRSMSLVTWGAIITGLAHFAATFQSTLFPGMDDYWSVIHRSIVLVGFVMLALGFQQIKELKG